MLYWQKQVPAPAVPSAHWPFPEHTQPPPGQVLRHSGPQYPARHSLHVVPVQKPVSAELSHVQLASLPTQKPCPEQLYPEAFFGHCNVQNGPNHSTRQASQATPSQYPRIRSRKQSHSADGAQVPCPEHSCCQNCPETIPGHRVPHATTAAAASYPAQLKSHAHSAAALHVPWPWHSCPEARNPGQAVSQVKPRQPVWHSQAAPTTTPFVH